MIFQIEHAPVNPSMEYAEELIKKVPQGTTEIVSRGGGSTIDVGKWVAKSLGLRHTAIPTTAGTGSEVTKYCVLTLHGKKTTFTDDEFIPDSYVLDPRLVVSLPELQTKSTGLDALAQALEALWSRNATPQSKQYSDVVISLVTQNLLRTIQEPTDEAARMNMLLAANFSGRAINITQTNVCHAISYPLTELYNIPHGLACAMSLGYFSKKVGVDASPFLAQINLPKYEIDKEKIADIVITSKKLKDYPVQITREDIIKSL